MQAVQVFECPHCSSTRLEKISERQADQSGFFAPADGGLKTTIAVYRCECDMTFTHSEQRMPRQASHSQR